MKGYFKLTPAECRLIARKDWRTPLKTTDISKRSGLSIQRVSWISKQKNWDEIKIREAFLFREGCGVMMWNESKQLAYLRRTRKAKRSLAHLDALSNREKKRLLKIL